MEPNAADEDVVRVAQVDQRDAAFARLLFLRMFQLMHAMEINPDHFDERGRWISKRVLVAHSADSICIDDPCCRSPAESEQTKE